MPIRYKPLFGSLTWARTRDLRINSPIHAIIQMYFVVLICVYKMK